MMHACTLWALSIQNNITNMTVVDQIYDVPSTSSGSVVIRICMFLASETVCLSHMQNIPTVLTVVVVILVVVVLASPFVPRS